MEDGDLETLKAGTVDYISISYYMTYIMRYKGKVSPEPSGKLLTEIKNQYLEMTEWGWPIDPTGFRHHAQPHLRPLSPAHLHRRERQRHDREPR